MLFSARPRVIAMYKKAKFEKESFTKIILQANQNFHTSILFLYGYQIVKI